MRAAVLCSLFSRSHTKKFKHNSIWQTSQLGLLLLPLQLCDKTVMEFQGLAYHFSDFKNVYFGKFMADLNLKTEILVVDKSDTTKF